MQVKKILWLSGLLWGGAALAWSPLFMEKPAEADHQPPSGTHISRPTSLDNLRVNSPAAAALTSWTFKDRLALSGQLEGYGGWLQLEDKTNGNNAELNTAHMTTANVFGQIKLTDKISARTNLRFGDNDFIAKLYQPVANDGAGVTVGASLPYKVNQFTVDEAFVTADKLFSTPFYVRAGRMYTEFGDYKDPYTPMPSLQQIMTQMNQDVVDVGWVTNDGFYGSVFGYRGNLKGGTNGFREWGTKFGFHSDVDGVVYDVNAGIVHDPRTIFESAATHNPGLKRYFLGRLNLDSENPNQNHALTGHAEVDSDSYQLSFDVYKMTGGFNGTHDTSPMVYTANAMLKFELRGHAFDVHGRGEVMTNGDAVLAYDQSFATGLTYHYSPHVRLTADGSYYKGSNGANPQFSNKPGELLIALLGVHIDI